MTSHTGQEVITINVLPNISKRKGKQTVKLGQLVEYDLAKVEKSY